MPATTLVCPHCEKTVEIQVSSVTRSRSCPECGQIVMLQMAEKSTKTKRRALLMGQNEPPAPTEPAPLEESGGPQPLLGDAFERMRMDPEIQQFRRRLLTGVVFVILSVVVLAALSIFQQANEKEAEVRKKLGIPDEPAMQKEDEGTESSMVVPEETPPPVSSGNLVFRPPGSDKLKTATAMPEEKDLKLNLAKLAAAEEVVGKFLLASDWTQRALLVRNRLRAAPLMNVYYAKNDDGPMPYDSIVEAAEISPQFSEHVVVFEGGGRRLATVEHTVEGPRVDWESFVGAGELAWSDFLSRKPAVPVLFRVLISPAGHFENSFGDPSALNCYSLRCISEPGAKVVYGYADKSSPLAKELDFWLEKNNDDESVPVILRLKFPPDAPVDFQVWIHQLVQTGWVRK